MIRREVGLLLTLAMLGANNIAESAAGESSQPEYLVKAALIYNFAKFTEWPAEAFPSAEAPVRFCVVGDDPFGSALDSITGRSVHGREVSIERLERFRSGLEGCHVVFVSASEKDRLTPIFEAIGDASSLTVSEISDFARRGGAVQLTTVDRKIRFFFNLASVRRAQLKISSKLLRLALRIDDAAEAGRR